MSFQMSKRFVIKPKKVTLKVLSLSLDATRHPPKSRCKAAGPLRNRDVLQYLHEGFHSLMLSHSGCHATATSLMETKKLRARSGM